MFLFSLLKREKKNKNFISKFIFFYLNNWLNFVYYIQLNAKNKVIREKKMQLKILVKNKIETNIHFMIV